MRFSVGMSALLLTPMPCYACWGKAVIVGLVALSPKWRNHFDARRYYLVEYKPWSALRNRT